MSLKEEIQSEIVDALKREKAGSCASLGRFMRNDAAWAAGRVERERERLIKWAEQNVERTHHLIWLDMEEAVERAAEEVLRNG